VPQAHFGPIRVSEDGPDEQYLFLSDVLPTAWQAVRYADTPEGGTLLVMGAGPIGDMAARIAMREGCRVIVVDRVPERLKRVGALGADTIDLDAVDDLAAEVRDRTAGRGADAVIDAVGMEAHGNPVAEAAIKAVGLIPDVIARPLMKSAGFDRLAALHASIDCVRRGGTVSLSGVYGGAVDPMPLFQMFDKQIQLRMGQANVRRWSYDILALL
jgi:threonine dehydrogenase-like Zn-dependent dehydrogenase